MIAKISTHFISFLLLPLYTALLSTEEYGEMDIYSSLAMIIIPFLTLQLEMGLFRFFITEKSEKSKKQIITTSFTCIFFLLLIGSAIFGAAAYILQIKKAVFIFLYYISMTISTVLLQVCRAYGDNKAYGMASFLGSALTLCLKVVFITVFQWRVEGILVSSVLAQLVCSVYMIVRTRVYKYFDPSFYDKQTRKTLFKFSLPLVMDQVSSWGVNYSDRIIILAAFGTGVNGIYSFANKFSDITCAFFNVFNVAWTENVVRGLDNKDNEDYVNKMFLFIFNIYFAVITGIVNLLPLIFPLLVNADYSEAYGHIPILLLGMFFSGMASTIGCVFISYGKTKEVAVTTVAAGACNVLVHLALLNAFGLYAASVSTLVSFGFLFIYRYVSVRKFFVMNLSVKQTLPQLIIYIFAWVSFCSGSTALVIAALAANAAFVVRLIIKNKDGLRTILSGLKKRG